jgi:capsular polysaccharide biosynthesis protein
MSASRIEMLRARLSVYEKDLADFQSLMASVPAKQRTIDELDHEIASLRKRLDELQRGADQAKVTANTSQGVSVVLLRPAGAAIPINTRDYVRLALAPAFSLVVGIGLAFFIDGLDLTVRTAAQAEEYLQAPVLASLSERRSKRG